MQEKKIKNYEINFMLNIKWLIIWILEWEIIMNTREFFSETMNQTPIPAFPLEGEGAIYQLLKDILFKMSL